MWGLLRSRRSEVAPRVLHLQEDFDDLGIKVTPCIRGCSLALVRSTIAPVRPVRAEGVTDVSHSKDARCERYLIALQPSRIPCAIPLFVVVVGNVERRFEERNVRNEVVRGRMTLYDVCLLGREGSTTLEGWSRTLDLRDKKTEGHSRRVTELTMRLARAMGVPSGELVHVRRGALLHDIGKMGIPDSILLKAVSYGYLVINLFFVFVFGIGLARLILHAVSKDEIMIALLRAMGGVRATAWLGVGGSTAAQAGEETGGDPSFSPLRSRPILMRRVPGIHNIFILPATRARLVVGKLGK